MHRLKNLDGLLEWAVLRRPFLPTLINSGAKPMQVQQHIITERVKINLLPNTYTYEIDGQVHDADWGDIFVDRDEMIESALEEIAIKMAEVWEGDDWEAQHEEFLTHLHKLHNELLPDCPI